jgi:anti-sigma factor RsiW
MGHLGARVSALLDGQLSQAEADEAWAHVYACHACRDLVEREGWVKTRLAGLSGGVGAASPDLKGSLLSLTPGEQFLVDARRSGGLRRGVGMAVLGGGALGAAMVGVLALGFSPGTSPANDRRPPASRVETPPVSERTVDQPPGNLTPARVNPPGRPIGPLGVAAQPRSAVPAWVEQLIP